jgi:heme/copper-type cytochrome/quinol oxidase subunit 2
MKKAILLIGILMIPVLALGAGVISPESVLAQGGLNEGLDAAGGGEGLATNANANDIVVTIINIMLWLIGILAVIMLIFGGIKYATSAGDSNKVTSAKNTIMYSVIGLIIAIFAYGIVNFVVFRVGGIAITQEQQEQQKAQQGS